MIGSSLAKLVNVLTPNQMLPKWQENIFWKWTICMIAESEGSQLQFVSIFKARMLCKIGFWKCCRMHKVLSLPIPLPSPTHESHLESRIEERFSRGAEYISNGTGGTSRPPLYHIPFKRNNISWKLNPWILNGRLCFQACRSRPATPTAWSLGS